MVNEQNKRLEALLNEDQFFYAMVITFLVFFLQYKEFDISSDILKPYNIILPPFVLITTRELFITLLLASSIIRYLTVAFDDGRKKMRLRVLSAGLVLFIPYFTIFDLSIRGLGGLLIEKGDFSWVAFTPLLQLGATYLLGRFVEKRWYRFYGSDKGYPVSCWLFMILGWFFYNVYYVGIVAAVFFRVTLNLLSEVILAGLLTIFTIYLLHVLWSKYKEEKSFLKLKKIQKKIYGNR